MSLTPTPYLRFTDRATGIWVSEERERVELSQRMEQCVSALPPCSSDSNGDIPPSQATRKVGCSCRSFGLYPFCAHACFTSSGCPGRPVDLPRHAVQGGFACPGSGCASCAAFAPGAAAAGQSPRCPVRRGHRLAQSRSRYSPFRITGSRSEPHANTARAAVRRGIAHSASCATPPFPASAVSTPAAFARRAADRHGSAGFDLCLGSRRTWHFRSHSGPASSPFHPGRSRRPSLQLSSFLRVNSPHRPTRRPHLHPQLCPSRLPRLLPPRPATHATSSPCSDTQSARPPALRPPLRSFSPRSLLRRIPS